MQNDKLTAVSAAAKAVKCRKAAELTSDPAIKAELLSLAEMFDEKVAKLNRLATTLPNQG